MFTKKIFALLLTIFTLIVTYSIFTTSNNNKIVAQQEKLQNKVKACFVILIRNNELAGIMSTISQIEEKFNKNYHYDYVFLNNELFSDHFKQSIALVTQATVKYGLVNASMWGYPSFINQTLAAEKRLELEQQGVPYALSESYRHMCR
jgi:alpha 1,2-mannosyltransferase